MKAINRAKDFSINVTGIAIPKNAIYGKIGEYYYYIDNFKQFQKEELCEVYIMHKTDKRFVKCIMNRDNFFCVQIAKVVKKYDLYNVVCVYPLGLGRKKGTKESKVQFAKQKDAQAEYMYTPSNTYNKYAVTDYSCSKKMNRWVSWR